MSTTTGNIKISQLTDLDAIDNGNKVIIPVSKDNSTGSASTPEWESYSVSASVLAKFMDNELKLSDVGGRKGFKSRVADLERSNTQLNEILGNYNVSNLVRVDEDQLNYYVSTTGVAKFLDYYSLYISSPIHLNQGRLYLLKLPQYNTFPSDISFISKVSTKGNQTVYEPLSTYFYEKGASLSGYFVFFATENMDVVISTVRNGVNGSTSFAYVDYGLFFEIADKLLTLNGEMMKVLVEAIVKNNKDIESLQEKVKDINKGYFESIDCDKCPSIKGQPMVVVSDKSPNMYSGSPGQIWINKVEGNAFICTNEGDTTSGLGPMAAWLQIRTTIK